MISDTQWKEGGNCNVCRRLRYCNHACRKRREWLREAIRKAKIYAEAQRIAAAGNGEESDGEK